MSTTPRTDAVHTQARIAWQAMPDNDWPWKAINEGWDFARQLERDLASVTAERDRLRAALENQIREHSAIHDWAAMALPHRDIPTSIIRSLNALTAGRLALNPTHG